MSDSGYILTINPGSTIFDGYENKSQQNLSHSSEELDKFEKIADQYEYRLKIILDWMDKKGIDLNSLAAVSGRGGMLHPIPGGTFKVTQRMIDDLKAAARGEHASNLGAMLAKGIAEKVGVPAFIVDPVATDELDDIARISGLPELSRRSLSHALNIKAVAHKISEDVGKKFTEFNLIVVHLGGGISVAPLRNGRIVDVNCANDMGPFSPEKS